MALWVQPLWAGDRSWESSPSVLSLGDATVSCLPPLCGPADVDECEDPHSSCLGGECKNTAGSYQCLCPPGFQLANGTVCEGEHSRLPTGAGSSECVGSWEPQRHPLLSLPSDVDECTGKEHCAPHGECLNSHGSFFCLCAPGFASEEGGTSCQGETQHGHEGAAAGVLEAVLEWGTSEHQY